MKIFVFILAGIVSFHLLFGYTNKSQNLKGHSWSQLSKKPSRPKKPRPSIEFGDKGEITMYKSNPYYRNSSPSITLNFGFNF